MPGARLPAFPTRLIRVPRSLLPRSRRRRGPSLGHLVYLGRHPIALVMSLVVNGTIMMVAAIPYLILATFWLGWVYWVMLVTMGWLCQCTVAAVRRLAGSLVKPAAGP
jgi:hypothetical protein